MLENLALVEGVFVVEFWVAEISVSLPATVIHILTSSKL